MDFINSPEFTAAAIFIALYIADAIATKTPNPIDNLLVRAVKAYLKKRG